MARKQPRVTRQPSSSPRGKTRDGAARRPLRGGTARDGATRRPAKKKAGDEVFDLIREALRAEFPQDTVDVSAGYRENIHVLVVSRRFDGMAEEAKQDLVWNLIDRSSLSDSEKLRISLIITLSPAQLK